MAKAKASQSRQALARTAGPAAEPPALVTASLRAIEAAIGGRPALVAALAYAPKSRDLTYVLGMLGDPDAADVPLATLCARGGITAGELLDAYKSGELNRAQAVGTATIGKHLPDVVEDTFKRALPMEAACGACQGVGQTTAEPTKKQPNPEPVACGACQGSGRLLYPGDLEHKKLALDMGKVLSKGGPAVAVQVNQNVGVHLGVSGGTLERLQEVTDRLLYSDDVVEGTVEEVPDDELLAGDSTSVPSTDAVLDDYDQPPEPQP